MATLQQAIALSDGVSGPLQKMANHAAAAVQRMERLGLAANGVETKAVGVSTAAIALNRVSVAASAAATHIEAMVPAAASAQNAVGAIGNKITNMAGRVKTSIGSMVGMFTGMFALGSLTSIMNQAKDAAAAQGQADLKLMVIMRQRMGANTDMIASIKDLMAAQQGIGVIGRSIQTAGVQQLATFLTQKDSLATLIPAMNNLAA